MYEKKYSLNTDFFETEIKLLLQAFLQRAMHNKVLRAHFSSLEHPSSIYKKI